MERLSTDRSIGPLVAQFVPLKIETDGDKWGSWARQYSHEGEGIPIVFVIRADGQKMYGKSGGLGNQLPQFLATQLVSAGRIFTPAQLTQVQGAVDEAKNSLAAGDSFTAVKRLDALKKLGPTGKLGSYAGPALEADKLVAQLVEEGKAALTAAKDQLAGNEKFAGALGILSANRIYGSLAELKKDLGTAERDLRKDLSLREMVTQAEAVDKALALVSTKSGKAAAVDALARVVTRFPDTPAAALAQEKIAALGGDAATAVTTVTSAESKYRTWTDVTGKFQVEAELVEATGAEVKLRLKKDGSIVPVPLEKLSEQDREFLKQQ
ncbi:MAG TPA: SHD1 domain-containing protein [Pirellulaceae bacterium]|nr:SHD1 domain-containing protein [Pirellulaceae bacterium]